VNKLRIKYLLKTFVTPLCWIRNYRTDTYWDKQLWGLVSNLQNFEAIGSHTALIAGNIVWIENYPYASGCKQINGFSNSDSCGRATALFLHDQLKKAKVLLLLKGIDKETSDHLIFAHKIEDFN
jgi:hypothetical protein